MNILILIHNVIPPFYKIIDLFTPNRLFARLNIARKMLLGYMVLVTLTVIVVIYALAGLQRLNSLNNSLINRDIRIQEAADNMIEALIAQDTYEKRYLILRGSDLRGLFWKRGEELDQWLTALKALPDQDALQLEKIETLHRQYNGLFFKETKLINAGDADAADAVSTGELRRKWENILDLLNTITADAKNSQDAKMLQISRSGRTAFITTALLCISSMIIGAAGGLIVTHHITSSVRKLEYAIGRIAEGDFDYDPQIKTADEIGGLARAVLEMGRRLKKLEEMYLDASPLTRLPGGIAIENVLKKRIQSGQPLAFCLLDIDNFKPFNDRYGYAAGNEIIKETAKIIEESVRAKGSPEDFVGHIGGDDFVAVTTPVQMREICAEIISRFDQRMPDFYDKKDRDAGYIMGKSRQGEEMPFPIMTISIAIVTNETLKLNNYIQASEISAELKDYAKTIPRSMYIVDKRRTS